MNGPGSEVNHLDAAPLGHEYSEAPLFSSARNASVDVEVARAAHRTDRLQARGRAFRLAAGLLGAGVPGAPVPRA